MNDSAWCERGPFLVDRLIAPSLCEALISYYDAHGGQPRSFQGVVDERLRKCGFVEVTQAGLRADVGRLAHCVSEAFGVELVDIETQDPLVYRYDVGPGFVVHHDEVTAIELERARTNGQPVIGGDITVAGALSQPETYGGGELFFTRPQAAEFKAGQGAAVTFPATRKFLHGVRPVTHGHRYALLVRLNVAQPVSGVGS